MDMIFEIPIENYYRKLSFTLIRQFLGWVKKMDFVQGFQNIPEGSWVEMDMIFEIPALDYPTPRVNLVKYQLRVTLTLNW